MRKILYATLASLALCAPASAQQTNGQLLSLINQNLPTNDQELITAAMVRGVLDQMVLSTNVFGQQSCAAGALSPYQPFTNNTTPSSVALTIYDGTSCVQWATLNQIAHTIAITGTTSFDNPTAIIGLTAINGTAVTAMRSDAAPAISQSIVPTWTGLHTFNGGILVPTQMPGDSTANAASTAFVQTAVGSNSPSNMTTVASPAALASTTFPTSITRITVVAMAATGTSTCSLNYTKGTNSPTGQYQEVLNTPSGVYWEPQFDTQPVRACQFGTIADGSFNFSTNVPSGTDNTAAVQNALDFAMRNNWKTVCVNDGKYKTTDTIAIGWGIQNNSAQPFSLSFISCNNARASYDSFAGVTFFPTQYDRCAFNVGGGRQTRVNGIHVVGGNYAFANARYLNANLPVATTAAGWLDPAITPTGTNPGGLTQFAPYAAFCVDAYNGSAPSPTPYPNQTFPAWLNNTTQYLQAGSTDTKFENTVVEGFAIGWAFGTGPGQQNGDFNSILNSTCLATVYCVSFGSSQSRNGTMQNFDFSNVYTVLTNQQFGSKGGELGGNLLNISGGQTYQLLDINISIAGITVQDYYTEAGIKVGNITGGSITLRNCLASFEDTISGVVPAALIEAGSGFLSIRFDDCQLSNNSRIVTLVHSTSGAGTVTFNGGKLNGGIHVGSLMGTTGSQNALNYTGGYFAGASVFPNTNSAYSNPLVWQGVSSASNMTTPTATTILTNSGWTQYPVVNGSRQKLTQAMQGFYDGSGEFKYWQFLRGPNTIALDMTGGLWTTALTLATCDTWTGQWSNSQQLNQNGQLSLGDIFYHATTGTIWVVESIGVPNPTHYPVILRQHNNMSVNASQSGGTGACTSNNLGNSIGVTTPPSGNTTLIHVAEAQAVTAATIAAGGSGYTNTASLNLTVQNGSAGSAGVCTTAPVINVTVSGNVVSAVNSITTAGFCPMPLTNPVSTAAAGGGTGATFNLTTYTPGTIAVNGVPYYCDFAAGSVTLTNCSRGDGTAGAAMVAAILPGDKFWAGTYNDTSSMWPFAANAAVVSVTNASPGSITLSNAASKSGRFPVLPFPTPTVGSPTNAIAAVPTATGTCPIDTQVGNNIRGTFQLNGNCASGTVILTLATTAPNGWFCNATDRTNLANVFQQSATSATTATFTGTGSDNDVISFECGAY